MRCGGASGAEIAATTGFVHSASGGRGNDAVATICAGLTSISAAGLAIDVICAVSPRAMNVRPALGQQLKMPP